ncbi:transmembrane protein 273 [Centrocercus urophasianus]|uniref:transmembrane protein 273 n=1 Tax=Centrocercus urophasianus TaxID=9002 RepID=UPI001C64994C|nr:transmembrane protein 273 [Centrocercus urophasianus]
MTSQASWIPVLMTFLLLLYFWRAKVYASGNTEEIDFTYLIIGVTLGAFLAIAFIAVIICMIKKQMLDHVFRESEGKMDRRSNMGSSQNRYDTNTPEQQSTNKQ